MKRKSVFVYFLIFLVTLAIMQNGCGEDTNSVDPPLVALSDLTRTGKFISFTSNLSGNYDIFLAQVNTSGLLDSTASVYSSNPYNLTQSNSSNDMMSNWSPDGSVLVFTRVDGASEEVYAYFFNPDGSIDTSITENPKKLFSSGGSWDNNPSFSPDGLYLIWDRRTDNAAPPGIDGDDSRDLYIGDITGSGSNFFVSDPRPIQVTTGPDEYNPKWAPRISIRRVAYEYQSSATSTDHDVYIIDPLDPLNNVNFYNPNNSGYPAWAPACDRIVFESDKTSGNFWEIVYLSYPASIDPVEVVNEAGVNSRYPTWLPNGGFLAYIRYTGSNGNLYIVSTGGGTTYKLLQSQPQFDAANNLWPAW